MDELEALQAGTVRPPEGKSAASEGLDGEVRGSRGSLIRMRDMDPLKGQLRTTHHKMLLRSLGAWCTSPKKRIPSYKDALQQNRTREHRNNHAHEEVVVVRGAAPHGRPQVTQEGDVGRVGERGESWVGGEGERMGGLRGRGSSAIWHHRGLKHCRT